MIERCFYCERNFGDIPYNSDRPLKKTKDHILARSIGGCNKEANIIECCQQCNSLKSNMTLSEFKNYIDKLIRTGFAMQRGYSIGLLKTISRNIPKLHLVKGLVKKSEL